MPIDEIIKNRIQQLIAESDSLRKSDEHGQVFSEDHEQRCKGWIAAANHIVKTICPDVNNAYHAYTQKIVDIDAGYCIPGSVGELGEVLKNLYKDIELGLVNKILNQVRAEVFDNFLDHAKEYLKLNVKNEAGVIAGVVFEDTIRRIARDENINDKDCKLDFLISSLTSINLLSQIKAKRARVAANVRTKATHAQWDEFDLDDVRVTIEFTEELISTHLDK
jgi:hypothetical protein